MAAACAQVPQGGATCGWAGPEEGVCFSIKSRSQSPTLTFLLRSRRQCQVWRHQALWEPKAAKNLLRDGILDELALVGLAEGHRQQSNLTQVWWRPSPVPALGGGWGRRMVNSDPTWATQ